ncbi:SUF system NifU family Fe-S cluster assembly protein [Anaerolineales bacterium HSG6]|nr:SUF system NifU family Fe-S cluster assembly protein [Anaerolineales bacterium HSG6]MDM8532504.1 SUF system NifU family Fe-S cluster assembly protein [Anaerolineales bacterium HSG25]
MDELYRQNILEHYRNPHNEGTLETYTHSHIEHNPLCGDKVQIDLLVDDQHRIDQVAFSGKGCAISQASTSMLTDMLIGKTVEEAKQIDKEAILDELGIEIGPVRLKCALLSLKAVKMALYGLSEEEWDNEEDDW